MRNYDIYLFDFDYTLADSSQGIVRCFQHVLSRNGYNGISEEQIKRTIGHTLEDSFSLLTGQTRSETLSAYTGEYIEQARLVMTAHTKWFPETVEVLTELKNRGARIGIISTKFRYTIREFADRQFPPDFFDRIVGREDVASPKPSPEGILLALESLGGSVANTLYLGDSVIDAQAAQAAGVDFLGVLHGTTARQELEIYPHVGIAPDLTGIFYSDRELKSTIIALEKEALKQWNQGNPDAFIELSAEDVVYIDPVVSLEGKKALTEFYAGIRGKIDISTYRMIDPTVELSKNTAVLSYDYEAHRDGRIFRMHCTEVYESGPLNCWKIKKTHWSVL